MAYSLNKAMILGNLTRDPESKATPSGQNVCNFSVATSRSWIDKAGVKQEKVDYHNVVAWAKLADICSQYLAKGRKVYIEGRIETRDWVGQDGKKNYRTEIVADNMILLDRAPGGSAPQAGTARPAAAANSNSNQSAPAPEYLPDVPPAVQQPPTDEIRIEDIPF
ncbi:MAG: single-stranded DNA-binding protein [bacterium]